MKQWFYILFIILGYTTITSAQNSQLVEQIPFLLPDTSETGLSNALDNDGILGDGAIEEEEKEQDPLVKKFMKKAQKKGKKLFFDIAGKNVKKAFTAGKKAKKSGEKWNQKLNKGGGVAVDSTTKLRDDAHIFAWHPHWRNESSSTYKYNLLSTISYFAYDINPETGNYRTPEIITGWKNTTMITEAQAAGCNVLLSITNFGAENNRLFLDNPIAQQTTIDSLVKLIELRGANGVDIDFENIPAGYREKFTTFVQRLSRTFKNKSEDYIISMAIPAVDHTDAFDILILNEYVDLFVIMGYDYHTKGSGQGPIAPLPPKGAYQSGYNLANSVDYYLQEGVDTSHLILGLPHYGTIWESETPDFAQSEYVTKKSYAWIMGNYGNQYEPTFDSLSSSYYFLIKDSINYKKCWFETPRSLGLKYDLVIDRKIGGAGIFALGYFDGHKEIWGTIAEKFQVNQVEEEAFSLAGHLKRNHQSYITGILFLICFTVGGVIFSMKNEDFRIRVIENKSFQMIFLITFIGILITLLTLYDWFNGQSLGLLFGLICGFILMQFNIPLPSFKRKYIP